MIFKILGGLLIAFGAIDLIGSFTGLDVWTEWVGIELPELLWRFSAYIELIAGFALFNVGSDG